MGFRDDESEKQRVAKTIVFPDTNVCYLRNFGDYEQFGLEHDPIAFLSEISQVLAHEFLHLWLNENISEEACSELNHVDGISGYLVERTVVCAGCQKIIVKKPYIMHGWLSWHKKCFKQYHDQKCLICQHSPFSAMIKVHVR